MRQFLCVVMAAVTITQSAPRFFWTASSGMNLSYYRADMPEFLSVEEREISAHPLFGSSVEVELHEFLRISMGAMVETREGVLQGNAYLGLPGILLGLGEKVKGDYDYTLSYLQIPFHIKIVVPLLIPGDLFGSVGPEIGINTAQDLMVSIRRADGTKARVPLDIQDSIETIDVGLGFSMGYKFSAGRSVNIGFLCGYYLGLRDVCRMSAVNEENEEENYDLYTRSIRLGVIFNAGFGQ